MFSNQSRIEKLTTEVLINITTFLDVASISQLSSSAKAFRHLIKDELVFRHLVERDFHVHAKQPDQTWVQLYQQQRSLAHKEQVTHNTPSTQDTSTALLPVEASHQASVQDTAMEDHDHISHSPTPSTSPPPPPPAVVEEEAIPMEEDHPSHPEEARDTTSKAEEVTNVTSSVTTTSTTAEEPTTTDAAEEVTTPSKAEEDTTPSNTEEDTTTDKPEEDTTPSKPEEEDISSGKPEEDTTPDKPEEDASPEEPLSNGLHSEECPHLNEVSDTVNEIKRILFKSANPSLCDLCLSKTATFLNMSDNCHYEACRECLETDVEDEEHFPVQLELSSGDMYCFKCPCKLENAKVESIVEYITAPASGDDLDKRRKAEHQLYVQELRREDMSLKHYLVEKQWGRTWMLFRTREGSPLPGKITNSKLARSNGTLDPNIRLPMDKFRPSPETHGDIVSERLWSYLVKAYGVQGRAYSEDDIVAPEYARLRVYVDDFKKSIHLYP